jgi:hypothetical protein
MATSIKGKWNKYPEGVNSEEDRKKYRESLLIPCVNCKRTLAINIWNRDFICIQEDNGMAEYTFLDIRCPICSATIGMNATVEPSQFDTQ